MPAAFHCIVTVAVAVAAAVTGEFVLTMPAAFHCIVTVAVAVAAAVTGEFVLTMPAAFYCTVSHGYNVSESVPFAAVDWLPWAPQAAAMHSALGEPPLLSYENLLLKVAEKDETVRVGTAA